MSCTRVFSRILAKTHEYCTTPSREAYSVCPYQPVRRPVRCKSYDFVRFTPSTE